MQKKHNYLRSLGLAAALGLGFCGTDTPPDKTGPTPDVQGPDYGINHDDIIGNVGDIFQDGRQVSPAEGEKLHSCGKLRYNVLGNILSTRGINITNATVNSTGFLYTRALSAWGVANFPSRVPEATRNSTSGLVFLEDIVLAMADEMLTAANPDGLFTAAACTGARLFNGTTCDKDGFACLLGAAPKQGQLDLCNLMVNDQTTGVTDAPTRKRLAVAALAGTVTTCD